jgi:lipoate-protein ligase B
LRGVTRHGFALNVSVNPTYWQGIVACGLDGVRMLNLEDLVSSPPGMDQVADTIMHAFGEVLGYEMVASEIPKSRRDP